MMKSKVTSVLLSLLIAFGLWLYVVTNVSQEADVTIYNVPVVLEGETLLNEKMEGDFPVLKPGDNLISWSGDVSRLVIVPNWRYL